MMASLRSLTSEVWLRLIRMSTIAVRLRSGIFCSDSRGGVVLGKECEDKSKDSEAAGPPKA